MANQKGRGHKASKKAYYERYKTRAEKQRKLRQERHAKKHPNDKQNGSSAYRKQKPENTSGWLTPSMDGKLTPVQITEIKDKETKKLVIPECAERLRDMSESDRKRFASLYARVRRLHNHASMYGKKKKGKGNKPK